MRERVLADPARTAALVCRGPTGFMDHVLETAKRQGWPERHLHREYFAGQDDRIGHGSFEIRLASNG
jgi:vanillate O-demethylase ferredoxin subunit